MDFASLSDDSEKCAALWRTVVVYSIRQALAFKKYNGIYPDTAEGRTKKHNFQSAYNWIFQRDSGFDIVCSALNFSAYKIRKYVKNNELEDAEIYFQGNTLKV